MIKVVLEGLLARREGSGDLLAVRIVRGRGDLRLQLGLERPAHDGRWREHKSVAWQMDRQMDRQDAHRLISTIISCIVANVGTHTNC